MYFVDVSSDGCGAWATGSIHRRDAVAPRLEQREHARQVSWLPGDDQNENLVVVTNTNRRIVLALRQWIVRKPA